MDLYILSFILVWRVVDFELRDKYKKSNNKKNLDVGGWVKCPLGLSKQTGKGVIFSRLKFCSFLDRGVNPTHFLP